ncbi:MAG: tetratricopeptide repeat protein [Paramuribaculum sp.]|nr:tetratricopeptide repeat protein [Paramuribaculum sp.]MDE6323027.1 tetratricopeptide repeat protein [Paramuribaculum sp.]MDE6487858.1 tetratricopeptide repeat protein [Paramuribaculum sp.]
MQRISILLLAACSAIFSIFAQNPSEEYLSLVEQADKAISEMKWDEAARHLNEAMRLEPSNPSNVLLMSNLGMMHFYAGRDSLALETLSTASRIAPASVTVLQNRARVLSAMGRLAEAHQDYTKTIGLDSTLVDPRFYRAMIRLQSGDAENCAADIEFMKRNFAGQKQTLIAESTFLTYTGRYSEAVPILTALIEEHPDADCYSNRALCYLMTDMLPEAAADIAGGLELDPINGELFLYRALLNKMRYRPDDAKADAEKARLYGVGAARIKALGLQ